MKLWFVAFDTQVSNENRFLDTFVSDALWDDDDSQIFTSEEKARDYVRDILCAEDDYSDANIVEVNCSIKDSYIARVNNLEISNSILDD